MRAAWFAYGEQGWVLAALCYGRALIVSLNDNVYHYGTPLEEIRRARDLSLMPPMNWFLLNFNLHGIHHSNPRLPWHDLPRWQRSGALLYAGNWFHAMFRQFAGPIPEPDVPSRMLQ
jgi:fatty acid desaturase